MILIGGIFFYLSPSVAIWAMAPIPVILIGAFARDRTTAVLATSGMVLGAYYLLWMLQRVIFGPLKEPHGDSHAHGAEVDSHHADVRPLGWHEIAGLTPLIVMIVLMGVWPRPFFARITPAVAPIAARFQALDQQALDRSRGIATTFNPCPPPPRAAVLTQSDATNPVVHEGLR